MPAMLPAISLFSGAGGMDVGFHMAGFNVQWANDIDPIACETFALNGLGRIRCGDLQELWAELDEIGDPAIVFGGPPCQGFSVAGKMDPSDSRSSQMARFFDVVEKKQPLAFVCENVKGLAVLSRWALFRHRLFERIGRMGYQHALVVLNAADFGVPQARERMFLIGFRADIFDFSGLNLRDALISALGGLKTGAPPMSELIKQVGRAGNPKNAQICNAKVTFARNPVLRKSPYAGMLFNGAGRPVKPFGASSTLPASMGGNKTPIVDEDEIFEGKKSYVEQYHRHLRRGGAPRSGNAPKRLRRLTVDECLAIQTFPSDFKMAGRQSSMYRQIGNAVPCKLAEAVARTVRLFIEEGRHAAEELLAGQDEIRLAS